STLFEAIKRLVSSMATPSPEGSSCKEPGSRRICSFGDTSVGITFPLTLAGFATMVLPSLLFVPLSRFKVTRDSAQTTLRQTLVFDLIFGSAARKSTQ